MSRIGIVIIGRNEGERLVRCLKSVLGRGAPIVYVDSGSTDGSAAAARGLGAEVVDLDMLIPFSAARGRNEGLGRLRAVCPEVDYVQFVDGDCEVMEGWVEAARESLDGRQDVVAVCGRLHERYPEASIYNRLCDDEWNAPAGEAKYCGGIAMFRARALEEVGGFNGELVAGEEPELCMRLRRQGWKVLRLGADMAWHDANISRFGQWWKRQVRGGYGALDVYSRFERPGEHIYDYRVRSARIWGMGWPVIVVLAGHGGALCSGLRFAVVAVAAAMFIMPAQIIRMSFAARRRGLDWRASLAYGVLIMLAKWPQLLGQLRCLRDQRGGRRARLIEYKGPVANAGSDSTGCKQGMSADFLAGRNGASGSTAETAVAHEERRRWWASTPTLQTASRAQGAAGGGDPKNIAYLINQYPKNSHTFIRREILAMEELGATVHRFSVRRCREKLASEIDVAEGAKTRVILDAGALGLLAGVLKIAGTAPLRFAGALWQAFKIGRRSERGVLWHMGYLAEACVMKGWLEQRRVSRLHAHFGTNSATVAMLCRMLGGPPYSLTIHGSEEWDKPTLLALDEKIRLADFVVAVNQYGRAQLWRWCAPEHWSKIHLVRCGVDGLFLDAAPTPAPKRPRLVSVGRLCRVKAQLLLVEAAAVLARQKVDFEIVLVGDGEMRPQVEAAISRHGLQDRITITGWASSEQVRQHITDSRALVMTSLMESLPVVIMEAFALGRPVICPSLGGIPELVVPGVNGWLIPPGAVGELADAMRQALECEPQRLEEMGRAGAERVRAMHDLSAVARQLAGLMGIACGRRKDEGAGAV